MKKRLPGASQGFTLFELMLVIVILVLILIVILINLRGQIIRGNDMKRKADLGKLQKTFEEYYNDTKTYPLTSPIVVCGSANLKPYIEKIPCDPVQKIPYFYSSNIPGVITQVNDRVDGYVLCAKLENRSDPDITRIGCHPVVGCGWPGAEGYNYCVSAGVGSVEPNFDPNAYDPNGISLTPTPTPTWGGKYACSPGGDCNDYGNPQAAGCPFAYDNPFCNYYGVAQCTNPANRCPPSQ
jgi:Tfp pilus assembly protein PilE